MSEPAAKHPHSATAWLWAALLLGLALRMAAVVAFERLPQKPIFGDSDEYLRVARNIRLGRGFMVSDDCLIGRMPGYPVFLALIESACGESLLAVRLAQAVVGTALVALVWLLARELYGGREAAVGAAIAAAYPPFILYTVLVLSETIFIVLLAWALLCLAAAWKSERTPSAVLAGVILGLATLVRASLLPFVGLVAVAWVLARRFKAGCVARAALMLAAFAATMAPWVVRNWYATGGHLVATTLRAGASLYEALNPQADGGPMMDRINWDWGTQGLSEYERDRLWRRRAVEFARENPRRTLELAARKLARLWNPLPNASEFRSPALIAALAPPFLIVAALGLIGLVRSRGRWETLLILLLPVVYYSVLHTVFVGSIRYRAPVMAMVIVLAAHAVARSRPAAVLSTHERRPSMRPS